MDCGSASVIPKEEVIVRDMFRLPPADQLRSDLPGTRGAGSTSCGGRLLIGRRKPMRRIDVIENHGFGMSLLSISGPR